jgi:hypothetical protein
MSEFQLYVGWLVDIISVPMDQVRIYENCALSAILLHHHSFFFRKPGQRTGTLTQIK